MGKALSLIILLILGQSFGQNAQCESVKTGRFNYALENRPELVVRTDSTQVEINPHTKVEIHSTLEWVSDCEYIMTYEKILNSPENVDHMIGQKVRVEIIAAFSNGYVVRATSPRIDVILEFVRAE